MSQIGERIKKKQLHCSVFLLIIFAFSWLLIIEHLVWGDYLVYHIFNIFVSRVLFKISSCFEISIWLCWSYHPMRPSLLSICDIVDYSLSTVNVDSGLKSIFPTTPQLTRRGLHCSTIFSPAFQDFSSVLCITFPLLKGSENLLFWRLTQEPKYAKFCHELLATPFVAILPQGRNFWILFE